MRTIKFRAFDKNGEIMRDWEYLLKIDYTHQFALLNDDAYIFMQFTGLHDKNGKEIYEGDILNSLYRRDGCKGMYEVLFGDGYVRPRRIGEHQQKYVVISMSDLQSCEIIGNIYQNPELIKP